MADLAFYINNILVNPPDNWQGVDIEVDFTNESPDASIKTGTYEWLGENAHVLNAWRQTGLFGGVGIFEGIPFRIETCGSPAIVCFDGVIDMTSTDTTFTCDIVKASVKETNRVEHVMGRASGFSMAYLRSIGSITPSDYLPIPYVISTIPDYLAVGTLIITTIELIKLIKDAVSTVYHDFETAATAAPVIWEIAEYIILGIIASAYAAFLTLLTVNTLLMLINEVVQPIKFKYGMRIKDMLSKGFSYLGLGFSSTIFLNTEYKNAVIIPKKNAYYSNISAPDQYLQNIFHSTELRRLYDDTLNANAYGYFDGTFADLIRQALSFCDGKLVIRNNIAYVERWDFWNNASGFTMPNQSSEAPFEDPYGTNASELSANYLVEYQLDSADTNTIDKYDGTTCMMTMRPGIINVQKNVLLKGLTDINLPFALAKRKEDLTIPEKVVNKILNFLTNDGAEPWDLVGGPWGTITFWANIFAPNTVPTLPAVNMTDFRIGAMLLSQDTTSVQKIVVVEDKPKYWQRADGSHILGYSIDANNNRSDSMGYTDAYFIQRCFHSASWAINTLPSSNPSTSTTLNIPGPTYPNQYFTYKDKEIPLCCSDFKILKDNNIIKSYDLKDGRLDSMRWNPFNETARDDFRIKGVYTKNLKQTIIIDGNKIII